MSPVHAVARNTRPAEGQCTWVWDWEDIRLACPERAIPGGDECTDHLILRVQSTPDRDVRVFGPTVVHTEEAV